MHICHITGLYFTLTSFFYLFITVLFLIGSDGGGGGQGACVTLKKDERTVAVILRQ